MKLYSFVIFLEFSSSMICHDLYSYAKNIYARISYLKRIELNARFCLPLLFLRTIKFLCLCLFANVSPDFFFPGIQYTLF